MIKYHKHYYFDTKEAAKLLGLSEYTIRRLIHSDNPLQQLRAQKLPLNKKSYLIQFEDLLEFAKKRKKTDLLKEQLQKIAGPAGIAALLPVAGTVLGAAAALPLPIFPFLAAGTAVSALAGVGRSLLGGGDEGDEENRTPEDSSLLRETPLFSETEIQSSRELLTTVLAYVTEQKELLAKSVEELEYLRDQAGVSMRGLKLSLQKMPTGEEKDMALVSYHVLALERIKIQRALRQKKASQAKK